MPGKYSGGYNVRLRNTIEGLVEANEDAKDQLSKDMVKNAHLGANKGLDDRVDFPEPLPSNYHKKPRPKVKARFNEDFYNKQQRYELNNVKTLYSNFETIPQFKHKEDQPQTRFGMTPQLVASMNVAVRNQMYYYGYQQLDKVEVKDEVNTLFKISSEDLHGMVNKPGGLIRGGMLKQFVIDKVKQASMKDGQKWHELDPDHNVMTANTRRVPDQFDDNY